MNANFEISRRSFLKGAGAVGAAGLLAACGSSSSSTGSTATSGAASAPAASNGGAPLTEYIWYESGNRELESWNDLYSQSASDFNVITNLVDGLVSYDCYGKPVPAIASSWESNEDASVWTFHLRDDVDWCDVNGNVVGHITSKDFLVGAEWVLNQYKNEANNTSMPTSTPIPCASPSCSASVPNASSTRSTHWPHSFTAMPPRPVPCFPFPVDVSESVLWRCHTVLCEGLTQCFVRSSCSAS